MTCWQPCWLCAGGRLCSWCDNYTRTEISRTKYQLETACKTASSRQSYIGQQSHSMHLLFKPCCPHGMAWQRWCQKHNLEVLLCQQISILGQFFLGMLHSVEFYYICLFFWLSYLRVVCRCDEPAYQASCDILLYQL